MFTIKGQNLILITLIGAALTLLAALLLLKPGTDQAQAQEGGNGGLDQNISYREAMQQTLKNHVPSHIAGASLKASSEGSVIGPQSDGSGIEVVPVSAFKHNGDNANGWFHSFPGGYIRNTSSSQACFMAPTYPPNGATLTEFRFSLVDDNAGDDLFAFLRRVRLTTGSVDIIAGGAFIGRDSPIALEVFTMNIAPGAEVVSNAYAYYIDLCFPADSGTSMLFYGARLFYTP